MDGLSGRLGAPQFSGPDSCPSRLAGLGGSRAGTATPAPDKISPRGRSAGYGIRPEVETSRGKRRVVCLCAGRRRLWLVATFALGLVVPRRGRPDHRAVRGGSG